MAITGIYFEELQTYLSFYIIRQICAGCPGQVDTFHLLVRMKLCILFVTNCYWKWERLDLSLNNFMRVCDTFLQAASLFIVHPFAIHSSNDQWINTCLISIYVSTFDVGFSHLVWKILTNRQSKSKIGYET